MDVMRDLHIAVRTLARAPGFAAAAVLTFALGVGVNLAVLSVVDRMMFRPLPYGDAATLVHLHSVRSSRGPSPEAYLPDLIREALRSRATSFDDIAAAEGSQEPVTIDGLGAPLRLDTVSANLLRVLQVQPIAGRDFIDDDARGGSREQLILLTDEAWHRRLDRSPDVFARTFVSGRDRYRIVGVLPHGFLVPSSAFAGRVDGVLLRPYDANIRPVDLGPSAIGRLRQGVTLERAQSEVTAVVEQVAREYPDATALQVPVTVHPVRFGLFLYYRPYVWLFVAGVSGVFLVACVNLATLFVARGRAREHDVSIRTALGASRGRIVRAALAEAAVLGLAGAGVAIVVCQWTYGALMTLVPVALQTIAVSPLDARLVMITVIAALGAALIAGGIPAMRAARVDVTSGLRRETRSTRGRLRGAAMLIAVQAALGVVLVGGATATVRSFLGIVLRSPGFVAEGLFDLRVNHGTDAGRSALLEARIRSALETGVLDSSASRGFAYLRVRGVMEAVRGVSGVQAAGAVHRLPVGQLASPRDAFWQARGETGLRVGISGGFFDALGTPVLAGRALTDADAEAQAAVVVVSETAVRRLWPGTRMHQAIGQTVTTLDGDRIVVGVVADLRPLPGAAPVPALFLPITAAEVPVSQSAMSVAVRMLPGHAPDLTEIDARLDARFGPASVRSTRVADTLPAHLQRPRFQAVLFGSIAVIGVILAAVGLYAVAAFDAARRRFEMGVRLTLGAGPGDLRRLLIRGAVRPVAIGMGLGLAIAWWLGPLLQPFVIEVDVRDPWSAGLVVLSLLLTSIVAAWLPARRASRTDPATVLRAM